MRENENFASMWVSFLQNYHQEIVLFNTAGSGLDVLTIRYWKTINVGSNKNRNLFWKTLGNLNDCGIYFNFFHLVHPLLELLCNVEARAECCACVLAGLHSKKSNKNIWAKVFLWEFLIFFLPGNKRPGRWRSSCLEKKNVVKYESQFDRATSCLGIVYVSRSLFAKKNERCCETSVSRRREI